MFESTTKEAVQGDKLVVEADQIMTVFFMFDSVLENGGMHSQMAVNLFEDIQSETLQ